MMRAADHTPNVFTIPPGQPFLRTLAAALLDGRLPRIGGEKPSPITLSRVTLLMPTRRATRALQTAFLDVTGGAALLVPKIRAIGDGLEDLSLMASSIAAIGLDDMDMPPAIDDLQRRLVLTQLVIGWSKSLRKTSEDGAAVGATSPAQAVRLAEELAALMDMVETEGVSLDSLETLVPEDFSEHWAKTLAFLKIVIQMWPAYLAEQGVLSPADRRNRLLRAEAERLRRLPPTGPVIVAGVTGSIPAAAEIIEAVAELPNGAIVLPALDQSLDATSYGFVAKHPEHPQFGLAKVLARLGVARENVQMLGGDTLPVERAGRNRLVSEALRPAETTAEWFQLAKSADRDAARKSLSNVHLIEAPTAQDEAEVVALILRDVAETPGRTAALVSPDRLLARRVGVRLAAWGLTVDDSAGRPFPKTMPGAFFDLVVEVARTDFAPAPLMALLKHPLTRLGLDAAAIRRAARYLELGAFRSAYLGRGLDSVDLAIERAAREAVGDGEVSVRRARAVRRLWEDDWNAARDLVQKLRDAYAPWLDIVAAGVPVPLQAFATAHVAIGEALAKLPEAAATEPPAPTAATRRPLWDQEAGEAAQLLFTGLMDPDISAPVLTPADYPDFYRSLVAKAAVRPRHAVHPRLSIWGPFEARLQQPDVIVLGGLNDGIWPESADPGPWLNRPMRAALGLPSPEERIGYAAHDFQALLGAERVYFTRAMKVDGVPKVPSRWLMRLTALMNGLEIGDALAPDRPWLAWARARDNAGKPTPVSAPSPCPPVALRPRKLAATQVERWMSNPYGIFAGQILGLEALPRLDEAPGAALKGAIIHDALGRFATKYATSLPDDIAGALMREAAGVLETYAAHPRVAAFWLPRFERFSQWFAATEPGRRAGVERVAAEVSGSLVFDAPFAPFTLNARADRIDIGVGGLSILDYKTGQKPSDKRVISGAAPQLPLEALIASTPGSGFEGVPPTSVKTLAYIRVTGGEPAGEYKLVKVDDMAAVMATARAGLARLIADFDDASTPYRALRRASFKTAYAFDAFAHLARVAEWSGASGEDGGEG